jgi:methionine-gamma-lyase
MAAITTSVLARVKGGDTVIAQEALYGATYTFFNEIAPRYGIKTVWIKDLTGEKLEAAFQQNPGAVLVFLETPTNPTLSVVDLAEAAAITHQHHAWLIVDNTFATPYCQRPLSLGADIVVHSTTKYLGGHGNLTGGVTISPHLDYVRKELFPFMKITGGTPSPFDAWLAMLGLKTFELRMTRHVENAMAVARYLEDHAKIERVYYPGLEEHPGHTIASRQMAAYGGMLSFELKGGLAAGVSMMNRVRLASLAPTMGNIETLIMHPASMSHVGVSAAVRQSMGITDGLVRLSVGIENIEDILADIEQAMS